jgi:heme-degrading protein
MKSPMICSVAMAAALVVGLSPVALALDKVPVISLDLARKMAAGCEAKAKEMNWKMNISVVDSGANQIFFEKMDGAYLGSGEMRLGYFRVTTAPECAWREVTGRLRQWPVLASSQK